MGDFFDFFFDFFFDRAIGPAHEWVTGSNQVQSRMGCGVPQFAIDE
ncbi:hypothetical protein [Streptomyces roseoverticillatus]